MSPGENGGLAAVAAICKDRRMHAAALALVLAVAAVYGRTAGHGFVSYDDDSYIVGNPAVTDGLSWAGVRWAFGFHAANWHPLTWLSHMVDCQLFGLWAGGHHLVSAGLHAANAVLLLGLLAALTGAFWRSAAVAAIFALHPLRVESVAWAAERKDVLSGLFWLLASWAYVGYARRPGAGRYLGVLALFGLGLMAKPMLVTLPLVLLLLDVWPLGRLRIPPGERTAAPREGATRRPTWALLAEKLPFVALSVVASRATLWVQTHYDLQLVMPDLPTRVGNALLSYLLYLRSFFWPAGLAVLYPYPRGGVAAGAAVGALAALVLVIVAAAVWFRRRPYLAAGWLWYLGTLVPVIGLVQVGAQARADRYTYVPMIGVTVALAWLAAEWWPRRAGARGALAAGFAGALLALAAASAARVSDWRDDLSFFTAAVRATRDNDVMLNNLGLALMKRERHQEAVEALREAERVNPANCDAAYNLSNALFALGRVRESLEPALRARDCYGRENVRIPLLADTLFNLGDIYLRLGVLAEAERHFREYLRIRPDDPEGRKGLAIALARQGRAPPPAR